MRLTVSPDEQERRLGGPSRREFDKMRSVDLLRQLRDEFAACEAKMPTADLTIDTTQVVPRQAALIIMRELELSALRDRDVR